MIDEISHKILKILQEKARIPNVEVARQVGMAPSAVLERIRKLEKQGIIDGYEVRLNPERFDRTLVAFVHVTVETGSNHPALETRLCELPEVQELHYISGEDGYLIKVRTSDTKALGSLVQEKIGAFAGVIAIRTTIVFSTLKETSRFPL
ncbi:MAG: Lrp/AsnC family transcriptional regulator [Deltaproteobacteria bacterium]|nr:Lrp/AsnC family transcriptional regulator [Deltaproteobacteria bacterium]